MYHIVLLSLVAVASANIYVDSYCPVVRPVENFNLEAFGHGVWYEVGRYPNDVEGNGQCSSTEYKLVGDTIHLINKDVAKGRLRSIKGTARVAPNAVQSGKLLYTLPYGVYGTSNEYTLWVLDTDYETYAINYYCKYDAEKKIRQDFVWVYSRTKVMKPEAKAKVDDFINKSKIIDGSKIEWVDFSEEACRVIY